MRGAPYYKPFEEGPLFPDEGDQLVEDAGTFLRATDRDVEDAVARQDIKDMSDSSFNLWMQQNLEEMGIKPPKPE